MSNEVLKKFSEELKLAREKKKLSLEKIFNKTRIDIKYLEAIESGNFSIMPDVYIRAFLKEYANCIGISSSETIEKYKFAQSGELYRQAESTEEKVNNKIEVEKPKIEKKETPKFVSAEFEKTINDIKPNPIKKSILYLLSAIGMLAFLYFMYNTLLEETTSVKEKPFLEVLKSQEDSNTESGIDIIDNSNRESITTKDIEKVQLKKLQNNYKNFNNKFDKLKLTITGSSRSWMRILIDDEKTNEFIIDYDITKVLYANEKFYLHIGNSGGVTLLLNGKNLKLKGSEGRVRKINITKNGIEYLRRSDIF